MAASPVSIVPAISVRRRPLALSSRRLEANRRNAARSTGPRTPEGKSRVARNAIKHGFFVGQERWAPQQHRDFKETLDGLREDLKPQGVLEESCVRTMAQSYVRMATLLRYENIAALKYHQRRDRELNQLIAAANPAEATRLENERAKLRRAGLWRPTIPGPREAMAIIRYEGRLNRAIRSAMTDLQGFRSLRSAQRKMQKQTHFVQQNSGISEYADSVLRDTKQPRDASSRKIRSGSSIAAPEAISATNENAKTNPLSSMFTGNRHQRRRAGALARRQT